MDEYYEPVTIPRYQWEVIRMRFAQLEEEIWRKDQWVRVQEMYPKEAACVLLILPDRRMVVGHWFRGISRPIEWYVRGANGKEVWCDRAPLYWMPLPAPPEVNGT